MISGKAEKMRLMIPVTLICAVAAVLIIFRICPVVISSEDYSKDSNVAETYNGVKGVTVLPEAKGKLSDRQLQDFVDEYGEDANITIYEVGE